MRSWKSREGEKRCRETTLQTVEKERTAKLIQKNSSSLVKNITSLLMSFFIYVAFVINAKSRYFIHFAYFVIAHCRTFVLPASRFLVCVHFRSSSQRVDFIDTLKRSKCGAFLFAFNLVLQVAIIKISFYPVYCCIGDIT